MPRTGGIFKCQLLQRPIINCILAAKSLAFSLSQMSLDPRTFETLVPSQFITFTIPNTINSPNPNSNHPLHTSLLRIAVLDSPAAAATDLPSVAAMLVPNGRETDWIFSTENGHLQLLFSFPQFSRLILIGNLPISTTLTTYIRPLPFDSEQLKTLETKLTPLVMALCPKVAFANGLPDVTFLTYDDDAICRLILEICVGDLVGEMLIEDVEIESTGKDKSSSREFRRRLRFKRMPNLIQTQLPVTPSTSIEESAALDLVSLVQVGKIEFLPDIGVLVHPYLTPMVAGLALIASYLDERIQHGFNPRALCVGVGGGALVSFLNAKLGFEVVGVEADEVVLRVARQYFGLKDGEFIRVIVGDGIKLIEKLACQGREENVEVLGDHGVGKDRHLANADGLDNKFDVVMVDLDSTDARMCCTAPPLEFVRKPVFQAAKSVLREGGILVMNVIPPDQSFYETVIQDLQEVFQELYEIDVGNEENFVLIATASPIEAATGVRENSFLRKLRSVISGAYMESIMKT